MTPTMRRLSVWLIPLVLATANGYTQHRLSPESVREVQTLLRNLNQATSPLSDVQSDYVNWIRLLFDQTAALAETALGTYRDSTVKQGRKQRLFGNVIWKKIVDLFKFREKADKKGRIFQGTLVDRQLDVNALLKDVLTKTSQDSTERLCTGLILIVLGAQPEQANTKNDSVATNLYHAYEVFSSAQQTSSPSVQGWTLSQTQASPAVPSMAAPSTTPEVPSYPGAPHSPDPMSQVPPVNNPASVVNMSPDQQPNQNVQAWTPEPAPLPQVPQAPGNGSGTSYSPHPSVNHPHLPESFAATNGMSNPVSNASGNAAMNSAYPTSQVQAPQNMYPKNQGTYGGQGNAQQPSDSAQYSTMNSAVVPAPMSVMPPDMSSVYYDPPQNFDPTMGMNPNGAGQNVDMGQTNMPQNYGGWNTEIPLNPPQGGPMNNQNMIVNQDYNQWSDNGYLDNFNPSYGPSYPDTATQQTQTQNGDVIRRSSTFLSN